MHELRQAALNSNYVMHDIIEKTWEAALDRYI
jgi:hypothetical protein